MKLQTIWLSYRNLCLLDRPILSPSRPRPLHLHCRNSLYVGEERHRFLQLPHLGSLVIEGQLGYGVCTCQACLHWLQLSWILIFLTSKTSLYHPHLIHWSFSILRRLQSHFTPSVSLGILLKLFHQRWIWILIFVMLIFGATQRKLARRWRRPTLCGAWQTSYQFDRLLQWTLCRAFNHFGTVWASMTI